MSIVVFFLFADMPENSLDFKHYCTGNTTPRTHAGWLAVCGCSRVWLGTNSAVATLWCNNEPHPLLLYTEQGLVLLFGVCSLRL